jgi:signal transduction histidine kinase
MSGENVYFYTTMTKLTDYRQQLFLKPQLYKQIWLLSAIILVFLGTGPLICQDQTHIDSLENMLKRNRLGDDEKTEVLLELTKAYGYNAPEKSIEYGKAALDLSRKTGNQINEAIALRSIGVSNHFLDRYDIAKEYYDSSLIISIEAGYKDGEGASLYNIGSIYEYMGDYNRSLEYYLKALKLREESQDRGGLIYIYSGIGNTYKYQNNYDLALENFNKCLVISEELDLKNEIAYSKYNIGLIYNDLHDYKKALSYYQESLEIRRAINDKNGIASSEQALGDINFNLGDYEKALQHHMEALAIATEIDNKWSLISALLSIGDIYTETDQYGKVLQYLNRALEMAREINSKALTKRSYHSLSEYYESIDAYKSALDYFQLYSELNDSMYNDETSKQITAMQTLYETEKKDKEIQLQKAEIKGNEAELRRRNIQRNALLGGITLVILLMAVLYRGYIHKRRTNILLTEQNREINQQKEEIITQRDYLETLNKELGMQKAELENALKNLKEAQSQLVESERMASLGQLTAGLAHELNNPLNFISGNVEPLKRDIEEIFQVISTYDSVVKEQKLEGHFTHVEALKEELELEFITKEINKLLEGINEGAIRSGQIVKGLRSFSRLDSNSYEYTNIHEGMDSAVHLLDARLGDRIMVNKNYGDIPNIECLPAKLNQVFLHLLSNSIQAIDGKGEISIGTSLTDSTIKISMKDSGQGMEAEVLANVFEPFFTTHEVGEGVGLGLSISYGIIKQHGGQIDVKSTPGEGAEFVITLPLKQSV